jgi:branched-chain amino acid transport system permease protein
MTVILAVGVASGCVYALVAVGYSLIYRTTGIVNFSQGTFVMAGGMSAYACLDLVHLPLGFALVGGVAVSALVALLLWSCVVLPLWRRRSAPSVVILATLVFGALVENVALKTLGTQPQTLPEWAPGFRVQVPGGGITGQYVFVALTTVIVLLLLTAVLRWTTLGRSMRACAASRDTSALLGISPERMGALAMVATGALGGLGGVLIAPAQYTSAQAGLVYGVFGFVAAVVGGFGSVPGALIGGILVGMVQAFTGRYISATYETVIAFGILLLLLAVRPQGILGGNWAGG